MMRSWLPTPNQAASVGHANRAGILAQHTSVTLGKLWLWWVGTPRHQSRRDGLVRQLDIDGALDKIDADDVAVLHNSERAAVGRLWTEVPNHDSVRRLRVHVGTQRTQDQ